MNQRIARAEARKHALSMKRLEAMEESRMSKLSDVGTAQAQGISHERLCQTVQEYEVQVQCLQAEVESLRHRVRVLEVLHRDRSDLERIIAGMTTNFHDMRNQLQLIRVSNMDSECSVESGDYRQLLGKFSTVVNENNRLRSKYERLRVRFTRLQERRENTSQNPSICPNPGSLGGGRANVPGTQEWAGGWRNLHGWKVPDTDGAYIRVNRGVVEWRNSIESGWVPAKKWGDPVAVHASPNVRWAGGE